MLPSSEFARVRHASGQRVSLASAMLLPLIPNPGKILCIGLNYEEAKPGGERL